MKSSPLHTSLFALLSVLVPLPLAASSPGEAEGWTQWVAAGASNSVDPAQRPIKLHSLSWSFLRQPDSLHLRPIRWGVELEVLRATGEIRASEGTASVTRNSDGWGAGAGLFLQVRGYERGNFSSYVEAGASAAWFSHDFPAGGTHFNGSPRFGLGMEYRVGDHLGLVAGARWTHVSNGQSQENPGFDGVGGYVGARWLPERGPHVRFETDRSKNAFAADDPVNSTAMIVRTATASLAEARRFRLNSIEAEYEYRPPFASWLGLTGSLGAHRASGTLTDPNHGLGLINPGSSGFSWSLGLRPRIWVSENLGWFVETSMGGMRFNRNWPFTSGQGKFHEPWDWARAVHFGAGAQWRSGRESAIEFGWRYSRMDTSDERAGDARDLAIQGPSISFRQHF